MSPSYTDTSGKPIILGPRIGSGGEGDVFAVSGNPNLVAKIYKRPPTLEKVEKLRIMVQTGGNNLTRVATWPVGLLNQGNRTYGFVMPKLPSGQKEMVQLYSPAHRKKDFPAIDFAFLIHAAMNCAAAFESVHSAGHVIGDVNQKNVVVDGQAMVRLIDCDSFQIHGPARIYPCPVGVGEYTPPEMHGKDFAKTVRSQNHDNFGLAVLIFHLLFMGRHPFAGVFLGTGNPPVIEEAVQQFRFAYGKDAQNCKMKSPPNALPFSTVPLNVQALFERAFLQQHVTKRPSASEWHAHLKSLKDDLFKCAKNDGHYFPSQLPHCPWCEQESKGIVFFTCPIRGARTAQTIQQQSLTLDLQIVNDLEHILLALNSVLQFAVPTVGPIIYNVPPMIKQSHRIHKYVKGCSIIAIFCTCLGMLGSFAGFTDLILWLWWLLSATGGSSYIRALKRSESQASDLHQQFNTSEQKFHAVKNLHMRTHGMSISSAIEDLDDYKNLPKKMNDELKAMSQNKRVYQEMAFLKQYAIDTCPVAGIGAQRKSQLRSFGIETAYDIEKSIITSLPGFGQTLCDSLLKWRASLLKQFRFDANKQITNFERDAVLRRYQQTAAALLKKLKAHKAKLVIAEPLITLDLQKPIDTINAIAPKLSHARAEANALSRL